jgi:hypothetical protein
VTQLVTATSKSNTVRLGNTNKSKKRTHPIRWRDCWRARHHGGLHRGIRFVRLCTAAAAKGRRQRVARPGCPRRRIWNRSARSLDAFYDGADCGRDLLRAKPAVSVAAKAFGSRGRRTALWSGGFCSQQLRDSAIPIGGPQSLFAYTDFIQASNGLVAIRHSLVLRRFAHCARDASICASGGPSRSLRNNDGTWNGRLTAFSAKVALSNRAEWIL